MTRLSLFLAGALALSIRAFAVPADCLILGDSIAVGTAQHLILEDGSRCLTSAKVGRPTLKVLRVSPVAIAARNVVISTGSNDGKASSAQFALLRSRIYGSVTWLLPAKQLEAWTIIRQIARILKGEMRHRQMAAAVVPIRVGYAFSARD